MSFRDKSRLNAATKRYARLLPPQLLRDYGAAEFYTAAQISASVKRAALPAEFIFIGQAQFLPREIFDAEAETEFAYDFLREQFKANTPVLAPSGPTNSPDGTGGEGLSWTFGHHAGGFGGFSDGGSGGF